MLTFIFALMSLVMLVVNPLGLVLTVPVLLMCSVVQAFEGDGDDEMTCDPDDCEPRVFPVFLAWSPLWVPALLVVLA